MTTPTSSPASPTAGDTRVLTPIEVHRAAALRQLPPADQLGFGRLFTDHVFRAEYAQETGWTGARIEPHGPVAIDPASAALHYAQAVFEGLKAFRGTDGRVRLFRLMDHCRRMQTSAAALWMPPLDPEMLAEAITRLVEIEERWVPATRGTALYIRPLLYATEAMLGVRAAMTYACTVLLSPVGSLYDGPAFAPTRLWVERTRIRAAPGGIGSVKAAANYAASLTTSMEARARGYDQVLWLDAIEHRFLEEAGTMNVFVRLGDEVLTPPLSGTILAGVTRATVLQLLRDWGITATERAPSFDELAGAIASGGDVEVFGSGTAAVISPVGALGSPDGDLTVRDGQPGPLAERLYAAITGIQHGDAPDPHGWTTIVA